jgi:hypothetical protein
MTVLFYIAVHEVEAALLASGENPSKNRQQRRSAARRKLRAAAPAFEQLEGLSRDARYECVRHTQADLGLAEARLAFIRQEVSKVAPPPYQ